MSLKWDVLHWYAHHKRNFIMNEKENAAKGKKWKVQADVDAKKVENSKDTFIVGLVVAEERGMR